MTLATGTIKARETVKGCDTPRCQTVRSRDLARLVPAGQRYGWDVIAHVGIARYLRGQQRDEIRTDLQARYGIELSQGTVSNLCDRFLAAFEKLHFQRAPALRSAMSHGYWMHVDGTGDSGKGGLFVCLDGWRGWVLLAARIPSENGETLRPLVEKVVECFGDPVATVRDLGDAVRVAVEPLGDRGVPDLLCHFHFLAAVGRKLFDNPHSRLTARVRALNVTSSLRDILRELKRHRRVDCPEGRFGRGHVREELLALVLWILEGDKKPPTYPFALAALEFVQRLWQARHRADQWLPGFRSVPENRVLRDLDRLASKLGEDKHSTSAILQLQAAWAPFSELRNVLRLSNADLSLTPVRQPSLPDMALFRARQIDHALKDYGIDLRREFAKVGKKASRFCPQEVIIDYLDRYMSGLVGHPVISDPDGNTLAVVDRTNNAVECFFSLSKRQLRRRVGRALLTRDMELQPAQATLALNLLHHDYVRVVCGCLENLPCALAEAHDKNPIMPRISRAGRNHEIRSCLTKLLDTSDRLQPQPHLGPHIGGQPLPEPTKNLADNRIVTR